MRIPGIGVFWAAFLNIGINSVGLLDPQKGLRLTLDVCEDMVQRVSRVL
jgi:hypothetical protein